MARVLVVDDDFTSQLILKKMVEGFGYDCDVASNGQEAITAALNQNYMAIMMDMFMPVLNGCDAAASITHENTANHPSIVGMISIDEKASRMLCEQAGMKQVLCKPIQRATLGQCLLKIKEVHRKSVDVSESISSSDGQPECPSTAEISNDLPEQSATQPRPQRLRRRSSESESFSCAQLSSRRLPSSPIRRL
jgi:CheY-like chemotaxis protein